MYTRPTRPSSRTEVPPTSTRAFCQPCRGALWVAVPPPFFRKRPGGLLTPQEALLILRAQSRGHAPSWRNLSVHLQWLLLMWDQRRWSQSSSRSWTGGLRVLFLLPLPGGERGTPLGVPAHNPCSVFPLSLSWVESSGCQCYCSVTVLGLQGLEVVTGRHEPKETTWASTAPSTICARWSCCDHLDGPESIWDSVPSCPKGWSLPKKTFLGVPSVSPGLLEQK